MLDLVTMRPAFGALLDSLPIDTSAHATVEEVTGLAIASVVARRGCNAALAERMWDAFGIALQAGPRLAHSDDLTLLGIAPGAWLAISPRGTLESVARLEATLPGLAAVCDQSGAYGVLRLTGPRARDLLQAGLFIDLGEPALASEAVIVSAISHMGVVLWRSATADGFEIATHRSEAASFAHWLTSSAKAAGVSLSRASATG